MEHHDLLYKGLSCGLQLALLLLLLSSVVFMVSHHLDRFWFRCRCRLGCVLWLCWELPEQHNPARVEDTSDTWVGRTSEGCPAFVEVDLSPMVQASI